MLPISAVFLGNCLTLAAIATSPINGEWGSPSLDRWMYPFNPTPGTRPTISTFGSTPGAPEFDSRDGQMLVGFITSDQVPAGLDSARYLVHSARVTVQLSNGIAVYDDTTDLWNCFVAASDPAYTADSDPGQPIELFGVGYRNGFTQSNFLETSPFGVGSPLSPGVRNAFAAEFLQPPDSGPLTIRDVSNSPRDRFTPDAWATGTVVGLSPGATIPQYSELTLELNLGATGLREYLAQSLRSGETRFVITSLTTAVQGGGNIPAFYAKENAEVQFALAHAAQLSLVVEILDPCAGADINCDGNVDGLDLAQMLSGWGTLGPGDIDMSGTVDGGDLSLLLSAWSL